MKKIFKNILITFLLVFVLIFLIVIINSITLACDFNHEMINITQNNITISYCFYETTNICRPNEINQEKLCLYEQKGFFYKTEGKVVLISFGLVSLALLSLYIYQKIKLPQKAVKFVLPDTAKNFIKEKWCKDNNIYHYYVKNKFFCSINSFVWYGKGQDYSKNNEVFYRCQAEIKEGDKQGIYTFDVNLSKGEEYIEGGGYAFENIHFDEMDLKEYKMPRNEPKTVQERLLGQLESTSPEAYTKLQEKLIEKQFELAQKQVEKPTVETKQESSEEIPTWWEKRYRRK